MKRATATLFILLVLTTTALGSQVYGTLKEGASAVAGARVEVLCGTNTYAATTDPYGVYKINVPLKGKCTFRLHYNGQIATYDIYSYDDPVRYDFEVIRQGNGTYQLKRK